jgi:hypothetical protein
MWSACTSPHGQDRPNARRRRPSQSSESKDRTLLHLRGVDARLPVGSFWSPGPWPRRPPWASTRSFPPGTASAPRSSASPIPRACPTIRVSLVDLDTSSPGSLVGRGAASLRVASLQQALFVGVDHCGDAVPQAEFRQRMRDVGLDVEGSTWSARAIPGPSPGCSPEQVSSPPWGPSPRPQRAPRLRGTWMCRSMNRHCGYWRSPDDATSPDPQRREQQPEDPALRHRADGATCAAFRKASGFRVRMTQDRIVGLVVGFPAATGLGRCRPFHGCEGVGHEFSATRCGSGGRFVLWA